jgi:hypothetical protein
MGRMTKPLGDQSTKGQESRLGEISGDQVTEDMVKVIQDRYLLHEGQINALRDRFRFNPDFPLKGRLRDAIRRYASFSLIKDHDVTTERTENRLRELERRCAALLEAIEKLPHRAELLLNDRGFDDYQYEDARRLVRKLMFAAHYSSKKLKEKSKRNPETPRINFVYLLADIWEEGTGKEASIGKSESTEPPGQETFYSFVVESAKTGNVSLADWGTSYSLVRDTLKLRLENQK